MKKFFVFVAMIAGIPCYAGTGHAKDIDLVELAILMILILGLGAGYYVDIIRNKIHDSDPKGYHTLHFPF